MSSRIECVVLYNTEHKGLLETYAESMGWEVGSFEGLAALRKSGTKEEYGLEDLNSAVSFFEGEGAMPVRCRIARVIYDSDLGIDEISEDEACSLDDGLHGA